MIDYDRLPLDLYYSVLGARTKPFKSPQLCVTLNPHHDALHLQAFKAAASGQPRVEETH